MTDYIKRLRQLREEKGLTLQELANQLEIEEGILTLIELGEMVPTEKQLGKITEFVIDNLSS